MDLFHRFPAQDFGAASRVTDIHPEEQLHDGVKHAAGKLPPGGLRLVEHRAWQPARADHAIGLVRAFYQLVKRRGTGGAVGIHVADQVTQGRELQAFDQRAAFADLTREFQRADGRVLPGRALYHAEGVVHTGIEHDYDLEGAPMVLLQELRVVAEHRFDALLL